ncbi:hypothetical protein [Aquimarina algicola]|uniref:Uncharacterized protein n=1 Tax=Aquimarina algicola TaxID=2589995 RepID=A0A504J0V3_9FLAO|nr:hypothetical protein [Aquimarina algicola]TPN84447.1 hypothetical protein FHK87_16065 [Aquimarina algicola]
MINLKPKHCFIMLSLAALSIVSCENEETTDQVPLEESGESIEIPADSSFENGFVIKDGKQIPFDDYIAMRDAEAENEAKQRITRTLPITEKDLNKNGMGRDALSAVLNRSRNINFKVTQAFGAPGSGANNYTSIRVANRQFSSNTSPAVSPISRPSAKWVLTRSKTNTDRKRVRGPITVTILNKNGRPDRNINLDGQDAFNRAVTVQTSIEKSESKDLTIETTLGASGIGTFFGISGEITQGQTLGESKTTIKTTAETKTDNIIFTAGDIIPKGKRCDFRILATNFIEDITYKITTTVEGDIVRDQTVGNGNSRRRIFSEAKGKAMELFPPAFKEKRKFFTFNVKSNFWKYEIERENCTDL